MSVSEDSPAPVVTLEGVPPETGSAFIPNLKYPDAKTSPRSAVGSTLLFATFDRPQILEDPETRERYQSHRHTYRDCELVVNGTAYPAVEVRDTDLGIRVCATNVDGYVVVATVPADAAVPAVRVTWPH